MGRIRHLTVVAALLLCGTFALRAQDSNFVRSQIKVLTSDDFAGRAGCYDGETRAAEYLASVFRQFDAVPLGDDGFQFYDVNAHKMEGYVSVSFNGVKMNPFTDYRIAPYAHSTHAQNAPVLRIPTEVLLDPDRTTAYIDKYAAKLRNAFLYIDGVAKTDEEATALNKRLQELTSNNPFQSLGILVGVDKLPVWGLSYTDFERNYAFIYVLRSQFTKKVKKVSVDFDNQFYEKHARNVCFSIPGTEVSDTMIVLTAHYDHLGCMGDDVVFRGAHDNAAGTSAVLDFARHYSQHPPKYTTVFLLFSGEESGLKGSRYFVEHPLIDLDKVKLLVNLDMFCGGSDGFTVVNYDSEGTRPFYDNLVNINALKNLVTKVNPRVNAANSDHYFFSKKCPALFIYTMGGRTGNYHEYTDTCENCGLDCYFNIFTLIREALEKL